jgi:hypothetical protein
MPIGMSYWLSRRHDAPHVNHCGSSKEDDMTNIAKRFVLVAGLMVAPVVAVATSKPAQAMRSEAGWCAVYPNGGENCGFYTQSQCTANVSGIGGFCRMSGYGAAPARRNG